MRGDRWSGEDPRREVGEELDYHIDRRAEELEASGVGREEARRRARSEFGDLEATRRYCEREDRRRLRIGRVWHFLVSLRDDAVHTVRALARRPGSVVAPGAILALGIALNALVFTVVKSVLLTPIPFVSPESTLVAWEDAQGGGFRRTSYPVLERWQAAATTLEASGGYMQSGYTLVVGNEPTRVTTATVTRGFMELLDHPMLHGRAFTRSEHERDAPPVALISESLWRRAFQADSGILERTVRLTGRDYAVAGIVRRGITVPDGAEVWLPLEATAPQLLDVSGAKVVMTVVRPRPGVSLPALRAELGRLAAEVEGGAAAVATAPLADRLLGDVRRPLLLLQGAVLLVLLATCANAGGILLARATARRGEQAVRVSLGAGGGRLMRAVLVEGAVVGLAAGLVGLGVAALLLGPTLGLVPSDLPRSDGIRLDGLVVMVALGLAVVTGVVTAVAPSLAGLRASPADALRGTRGAAGESPWLRRVLDGFVVGQVALAVVLTIGAGLLVRSFIVTLRQDPGFDPEGVTVAQVDLPPVRYEGAPARLAFARTLMERASALPGVQTVAIGVNLPISGSRMTSPLKVEGYESLTATAQIASVTSGYFDLMRIPIEEGQPGADWDREDGPLAILVDATLRTPDGSPFRVGDRAHSFFGNTGFREVQAIVAPVRHSGLRSDPEPTAYQPLFQRGDVGGFSLLVRAEAPFGVLAPRLRNLLRDMDPEMPLDGIAPMEASISRSVASPRFYTLGLSVFGGLALVLALAGCQAGLAFRVGARRRELGLRMALGASSPSVRGMIIRRGLALTAAGAAVGIAATVPLSDALESQLFGVAPTDPVTYVALLLGVFGATAVVADVPARRAATVDPAETLRGD